MPAGQAVLPLPALAAPTNGLEGRLAALGRINSLDVETKLKLFV